MRLTSSLLLSLLLAACLTPLNSPSEPVEASQATPTTELIGRTPPTDSWQTIAPGIEQRLFVPDGDTLAQMVALRVDPAMVEFRAHYRPAAPYTLFEWREAFPQALAFINANFFDPERRALGLVVSDGQAYGTPYTDRGGLFAVDNAGGVAVRSNIYESYRGEPLWQAVQGFPMLVHGRAHANTDARQTQRSRRSIIGQDDAGRILLLATPGIGLGLYDLGAYLARPELELNLVNAFNLDGGGSTMLYIAATNYTLISRDPVPTILALYPRS